jgi:hypothetical protein
MLTTYLRLVPRSRKRGSTHPLPLRLNGVMLNYLCTRTNILYLYGFRLFYRNFVVVKPNKNCLFLVLDFIMIFKLNNFKGLELRRRKKNATA